MREMGNKRNRRSRLFDTPSADRDLGKTQVEISNQGNETLTIVITVVQETLDCDDLRLQLAEPDKLAMRFKCGLNFLNRRITIE